MGEARNGAKYFRHQIFNESGYVLMYPNIRPEDELLQSFPPDPLTESATQQFPLGTKLIQGERVWRYCKNSASAITVVGNILQGPAAVHATIEDDIVVAASKGQTYAIGSYDITVTSTTDIDTGAWATEDGAKEGYIYVNGGTGIGQCRKIKHHEAFVTTGTALVEVYEPWKVAPIAGDTEVGLAENSYSNVVVAAAGVTAPPVGVATIAITASYYFWAQSGGPCAVTCHAAIAHGVPAVVGTTAGEIDPFSAFTTEYIVGWPITPGIKDNDAALIFLTIDR
uniref:Uncharacterized protein n=1 Tax=viral metagenome TaxID=1070528 RepID=A0A6M3KV46_9ZZZZ